MTPKQAHDHGAERARNLVRLYHLLLNKRKRKIRSDWKENLCSVMHWPKGSQIQRFDSQDALIVLKPGSTVSAATFTASSLDELLRSALVLAVSALDRYVHERVVKKIVSALRARSLNRKQEDFSLPATRFLQLSAELLKAQKAGTLRRPANEVRKVLQKALHERPFQSWREIEGAFALIGITDLAGKIQSAGKLASIKPIQKQLNDIVRRRNEIVHEADLVRHQRGGMVRVQNLDPALVERSLDFLDSFVAQLEAIR
jgi:hypothetical protein